VRLACVVIALLAGCKGILGIESGVVGDGGMDSDIDDVIPPVDVAVDARTCFGTFQQICLSQPPPDIFQVTTSMVLDSATQCTETQTFNGMVLCIQSAKHIVVNAGVTIGSLGDRYLVFVGTEDITIEGTIDSWTAGPSGCTTQQGGVSAGGAGGSFGTAGGNGSPIGTQPRPAATTITTFRRGCDGDPGGSDTQGGNGGDAGSGIFLVSPSIHLKSGARINASGWGGYGGNNDRGGGGGGSGGFILFDSERLQIDAGAVAIALGGGGGGGGGAGLAEHGKRASATLMPIVAGEGGAGDAAASGDGGDGASTGNGQNGGFGSNGRGSGGGGGGTGVIFATALPSAIVNSGTVVPPIRQP
jgi:hypothetical protein